MVAQGPDQDGQRLTRSGRVDRVAHGSVGLRALGEHAAQYGNVGIDVVVDASFGLLRVRPVEPAGVLDDGALPCDRHGEQERVETGVVEALADESPGREHQSRLIASELPQAGKRVATAARRDLAVERDELRDVLAQAFDEAVEMVAALCEDDWSTTLLEASVSAAIKSSRGSSVARAE